MCVGRLSSLLVFRVQILHFNLLLVVPAYLPAVQAIDQSIITADNMQY